MTETDPLCTVVHMRRLKLCSSGAREFARLHGLDWTTFIREGLPASRFESTNDHYGLAMAQLARSENEGGDRGRG